MTRKDRSPTQFYEDMVKYEDRKHQKMLMLLIDKEKKEISELKKGVNSKKRYVKLYNFV